MWTDRLASKLSACSDSLVGMLFSDLVLHLLSGRTFTSDRHDSLAAAMRRMGHPTADCDVINVAQKLETAFCTFGSPVFCLEVAKILRCHCSNRQTTAGGLGSELGALLEEDLPFDDKPPVDEGITVQAALLDAWRRFAHDPDHEAPKWFNEFMNLRCSNRITTLYPKEASNKVAT
eukprot:4878622-Amphidinium_carterae.2